MSVTCTLVCTTVHGRFDVFLLEYCFDLDRQTRATLLQCGPLCCPNYACPRNRLSLGRQMATPVHRRNAPPRLREQHVEDAGAEPCGERATVSAAGCAGESSRRAVAQRKLADLKRVNSLHEFGREPSSAGLLDGGMEIVVNELCTVFAGLPTNDGSARPEERRVGLRGGDDGGTTSGYWGVRSYGIDGAESRVTGELDDINAGSSTRSEMGRRQEEMTVVPASRGLLLEFFLPSKPLTAGRRGCKCKCGRDRNRSKPDSKRSGRMNANKTTQHQKENVACFAVGCLLAGGCVWCHVSMIVAEVARRGG